MGENLKNEILKAMASQPLLIFTPLWSFTSQPQRGEIIKTQPVGLGKSG
jgi:hypothetical protein